jgi:hypothetical protein
LTVNKQERLVGVGAVRVEKLHRAPSGKPEQAKEKLYVGLKPPTACTVIVVVPLCTPWTETDEGLAAIVKSGGIV